MDQFGQPKQTPKVARPSWQETLTTINSLLLPSQEGVILLRPNPSLDTLIGGLALSHSFKKIGRKAHIVAQEPIDWEKIISGSGLTEKLDTLLNFNQIVTFLPKKQLRIVIDYASGTFSKAGVKKEADGLMVNLSPEPGQSPIEPLNVAVQDLENKPDVAFLIEAENLFHLGEFYSKNQEFFSKTPIVNIDYHSNNSLFGKANLIDTKATSISEMITLMLYDLRFVIDEETAKILYVGMKSKTEGFSPNYFTANMLEATSICLRYMQKVSPL